jgi:hypothetical protein
MWILLIPPTSPTIKVILLITHYQILKKILKTQKYKTVKIYHPLPHKAICSSKILNNLWNLETIILKWMEKWIMATLYLQICKIRRIIVYKTLKFKHQINHSIVIMCKVLRCQTQTQIFKIQICQGILMKI